MAETYDLSTDAGKVRLLIPDTDVDNVVLRDDEIDAFLEMEGDVRLAAAAAIETIATNEALIQKVLRSNDISTDGAKLAETLMKRATALRAQASSLTSDDDDQFAVAEFADPVFGQREYLTRHWVEL